MTSSAEKAKLSLQLDMLPVDKHHLPHNGISQRSGSGSTLIKLIFGTFARNTVLSSPSIMVQKRVGLENVAAISRAPCQLMSHGFSLDNM